MRIAIPIGELIGWQGGVDFLRLIVGALRSTRDWGDRIDFVEDGAKVDPTARRFARIGWRAMTGRDAAKLIEDEVRVHASRRHIRRLIGLRRPLTLVSMPRDALAASTSYDAIGPIQSVFWEYAAPSVGYIWDLQHKFFPQLFASKECDDRDQCFRRTLRTSKVVLVNSHTAAKHIRRFYDVGHSQIVVLPFGACPEPEWLTVNVRKIQKKYSVEYPYFICCNQFWKHKNHRVIFDAIKLAAASASNLKFVFTGETSDSRWPAYFDELVRYVKSLDIENNIRFLGLIPKLDQIALLRGAIAAVQPTLFEGQPGGGSIYDAIAVGQRTIVSDLPVNREIESEVTLFFDPTDPHDLLRALLAAAQTPVRATRPATLIKRGLARRRVYGRSLRAAFENAARAET